MRIVKVAGVIVVAAAFVALAVMRSKGLDTRTAGIANVQAVVTPDPFGTDEQVVASLSDMQRGTLEQRTGTKARITTARSMATQFKFTGQPSELEWFVREIEAEVVPATIPPMDDTDPYWVSDRGRVCDLLRTIGIAWVYAGPFEGMEERVTAAAARFVSHPDRLVRGQAGLALYAVKFTPTEHTLPGDGEAAYAALMANADDRVMVEVYARGTIAHAREQRIKREQE